MTIEDLKKKFSEKEIKEALDALHDKELFMKIKDKNELAVIAMFDIEIQNLLFTINSKITPEKIFQEQTKIK